MTLKNYFVNFVPLFLHLWNEHIEMEKWNSIFFTPQTTFILWTLAIPEGKAECLMEETPGIIKEITFELHLKDE